MSEGEKMDFENEDVSAEIETSVEDTGTEEIETADDGTQEGDAEGAEAEAEETEEAGEEGDEEAAEGDETSEGDEGDEEGAVFKPNTKFKVLDKEMEIPKKFHSLMKDESSANEIRELFEKANGLDVVKTKLTETRTQRDEIAQEANRMSSAIGKARSTFQRAVQSGNLHLMDDFFGQLQIPVETIMNYAIEKAKLHELRQQDPAQAHLIENQTRAQRQQWESEESATQFQDSNYQTQVELKRLQLETALSRPDTAAMSQELEQKFGKPGIFREELIRAGEEAFSREKKNITVDEAIKRVASRYGLTGKTTAQAAGQNHHGQQGANGGKRVIQRKAGTIPNINGSGGSSPLRTTKPRSIEDLKKLSAKANAGEQI